MTVAVYCRLSKEDEESESIKNQKALLIKYALDRDWEIYKIYCDEDYSGADRDRPEFIKLIDEAKDKKFNAVLVKTQSRFTRDMECVERYIHGLFPIWGIRFISVVDNADTEIKGNKKARQINGLINEWYLEDLSENIRAVLDCKRKSGQYIGGFPVYGYKKSPDNKNKLVVDDTAAGVVREIYRLYLAGKGKTSIAAMLNAKGVPNPTKYKQLQGLNYINGAQTDDLGLWSRTTVGRILKERMYTGDIVQGRRKKISYKSKRLIQVPERDWIVVGNTHEEIIDKSTFEAVNRLLKERTKSSGTGAVHALAGKVKCMDCGSSMIKTSNTYKGMRRSYLRCGLYASDKSRCSNHAVRLDELEKQVLQAMRRHIDKHYDRADISKLVSDTRKAGRLKSLCGERRSLERIIERREKALSVLYIDRACGVIEQEQFKDMNRSFIEEKNRYRKRLIEIENEISEAGVSVRDSRCVLSCLEPDELPRELVAEFINKVEVGMRRAGEQEIKINWLF